MLYKLFNRNMVFFLVLGIILSIFGCHNFESNKHEPEYPLDFDGDGIPDHLDETPDEFDSDSLISSIELADYKISLDVTKNIKKHKKGNLRVWIGLEAFMPEIREKVVRDITTIPMSIGKYAKVTPYAPDFEVSPEQSQCIRIHPSGSSVLFTLIPLEQGEFEVSAKVELFEESDCSGTPIPKSSETLTVFVTVDKMEVFQDKFGELLSIFWDKFLSFWGAFITIMFGVIIYLIRKFLKKKTGYNEKD